MTGGCGAIGGAIAPRCAAAGHTVACSTAMASHPSISPSATVVRAPPPACSPRTVRCDVLVHAAAAFDRAALADLEPASWRHVQAVNVESALWLCRR